MATPATPITFTLANNTANQMAIRNFSYVDNSNITHHANYSNLNYGGSDNSDNSTLITRVKQYQTGDYLQRTFVSDTHARTVYYSTHTGNTLTIKNSTTEGLYGGWTADSLGDNAFDGLTIVSIGGPTTIVLSGTPSIPLPIQGESIVFSISPNKITIDDTSGINAAWQIRDNGYSSPATVVSVVDSQTLIVSALPTNPTVGNTMLFTSSTNYLTVNNTTDIQAGWTAQTSDNAYNGSQYVVSVISGTRLKMSAQPNNAPSTSSPANQITFTSDQPLTTINAGQSKTFTINYTNNNSTPGVSIPSAVTINAKNLGNNNSIIGYINNYVSINNPPPPPPTFTNAINGGNFGNGRGGYGGDPSATNGNTCSVGQDPGDSPSCTASSVGAGGGGGGSGRVICTHFYRKDMMSKEVWRADMEYTFKRLSPATIRGYQYWAIPYVKLMRRSPLAEKIMYPLMMARAEELAYQMGVLEKRNWAGVLVRLVFEPICFTIGLFVGEQDWKSLWNMKSDRNM